MRKGGSILAWVCAGLALLPPPAKGAEAPIDRQALVSRHNIVVHEPDPLVSLAVGNGEFAFNTDVTGLQSFPEYYEKTMPIGILSNWGWHSFPNPKGYTLDKFKFTCYQKWNRQICYPYVATDNPQKVSDDFLSEEARYLRFNPHRFGLGRIGLEMTKADGSRVAIGDLRNLEQKLDLWAGILTSTFEVDGSPVRVETAVHPQRDEVAVRVVSPMLASGRLKVRIGFAYASGSWGIDYEDWSHPDAHRTTIQRIGRNGAVFQRQMDNTRYYARAAWSGAGTVAETSAHHYLLSSPAKGGSMDLVVWFGPKAAPAAPDSVQTVQAACRGHWKQFWTSGGAVDFSGTEDPRAKELERRIVLSQYVTAVHSSGSLPPQESGLACDTWHGKFHMEMYWWHTAHFALWGRPELLEHSMRSLETVLLPKARETARKEGYRGARWQKMTDPNGDETPSWVGPMLVWQQPHPIHMAELIYRDHPNRQTLDRYRQIVFETADFMASFVDWDEQRKQYVLGPGIGSADERHVDFEKNINPTMELGYWRWGLETAQQWRERLGLAREEQWDHVLQNLSPLPVRNGIYPVMESIQEPGGSSMTAWLYGILPGKDVNLDVLRRTLQPAGGGRGPGGPQQSVTWGISMAAMSAARTGDPERAVSLLVAPYQKNPFLASGYAYSRSTVPVYLPANGGWLSAVAMMAAGWTGAPEIPAPGFPRNWKVRWEGLHPMP